MNDIIVELIPRNCPTCRKENSTVPYRYDRIDSGVSKNKRNEMDRFIRCRNCGEVSVERWRLISWRHGHTMSNKEFREWENRNPKIQGSVLNYIKSRIKMRIRKLI